MGLRGRQTNDVTTTTTTTTTTNNPDDDDEIDPARYTGMARIGWGSDDKVNTSGLRTDDHQALGGVDSMDGARGGNRAGWGLGCNGVSVLTGTE
jgi:hypothetical protein